MLKRKSKNIACLNLRSLFQKNQFISRRQRIVQTAHLIAQVRNWEFAGDCAILCCPFSAD